MYQDKTLTCKDCGCEFTFTASEQEFYAEKGFENEPGRCKQCRDKKKTERRSSRRMFTAVCEECGKTCEIPFEPRDGRAVYCSECFSKKSR